MVFVSCKECVDVSCKECVDTLTGNDSPPVKCYMQHKLETESPFRSHVDILEPPSCHWVLINGGEFNAYKNNEGVDKLIRKDLRQSL